MKLTNIYRLPQPIFDAVSNDPYNKGDADYSITGLLTPPRIAALSAQYDSEITEDVSDRIFSLIGQVVHGILERSEREAWAEKRYYMSIGDVRISGQLDRFHKEEAKIQDYKVTSLWKIKDGCPQEWEEQVNCYAHLMRANDYVVDKAEVVAILRDWHKRGIQRDPTYPLHQVAVVPVTMWPTERIEAFIIDRIGQHIAAKITLPLCTDAERWNDGDRYAVMKKGSKRAIKLYDKWSEATEHKKLGGEEYYMQLRKGENKRCQDYCKVASHCEQYKLLGED